MAVSNDTIAAIATPLGRGGIGVIRVSGPSVSDIALAVVGKNLKPRFAHYATFKDQDNQNLDMGLALYFPGPNSFTGEDVLELQGHGGPVILEAILERVVQLGARLARPGEFSERAFLNDKIDLAQAEAIADLIDSSSRQAASSAMRSLQGEFSSRVNALQNSISQLRIYVEAAIDFPEEEIDFLGDGKVLADTQSILATLDTVFSSAQQGVILREGMSLVIAGAPNAGKSTLLNLFSGRESAIVTDIPGTTRDIMREHIQLDGIPLHIIDTAGLRQTNDVIEQEGIKRAWKEIEKADRVLFVIDSQQQNIAEQVNSLRENIPEKTALTVIQNKIDLTDGEPHILDCDTYTTVYLSAKTGRGFEELKSHLKQSVGYNNENEDGFIARRRHLDALERTKDYIEKGLLQLQISKAGELLAEELRQAQLALSEITGEITPDDLLGQIFSSFCIGK